METSRTWHYPALIRLCGTTPDWEKKAQHYKDKKDAATALFADDLAASFFEWEKERERPTQHKTAKK